MKYLLLILAFNFSFAQTDVFDCARTGTAEEMEAFYTSNPELVDALNDRGSSPLTLAAYYNNIEVANYLIDKVDNINGNSDDGTPLMAAVVSMSTARPYSGLAEPSMMPLISLNWRLTSTTTAPAARPTASMAMAPNK